MERQPSSVRDPVCGMEINPQHAAATTAYQGQTFYFCRVQCQEQFDQSLERVCESSLGAKMLRFVRIILGRRQP